MLVNFVVALLINVIIFYKITLNDENVVIFANVSSYLMNAVKNNVDLL